MADRYPLVVASSTVQELAQADRLDLGKSGIVGVSSIQLYTDDQANVVIRNPVPANSVGQNLFIGDAGTNVSAATSAEASHNVSVGTGCLTGLTTGFNNTGIGQSALRFNSTGYENTAVGEQALTAVTSGYRNTAVGRGALRAHTSNNSSAFGLSALASNTTGSENSAFGVSALSKNLDGSDNVAVGANAGFGITGGTGAAQGRNVWVGAYTGDQTAVGAGRTARWNVAVGYQAGGSLTSGVVNTAVGYQALQSATTTDSCTALGRAALNACTTGSFNLAVGSNAFERLTTGGSNVAVGHAAAEYLTTGSGNCFVGPRCATNFSLTSASDNTGIGGSCFANLTTGSGNVVIGPRNAAGTHTPVFDVTTEDNRFVAGSTAVTNAYVQVAWTVVSDSRDKVLVGVVPHGLEFVEQLDPKAFKFKVDRNSEETHGPVRYGFYAQEVAALEGENPVIIDTEDPEKLRYKGEHLVPVLVNAIKELSAQVKDLQAEVAALKG